MTRDERLGLDEKSKGLIQWEKKGRPRMVFNGETFDVGRNKNSPSKKEKKALKKVIARERKEKNGPTLPPPNPSTLEAD